MTPQIYTHQWLTASRDARLKMATIFNIPRTASCVVDGNQVLCDGHSNENLLSLSIEKMQEFTGLDLEDVNSLFKAVVDIVENNIKNPVDIIPVNQTISTTLDIPVEIVVQEKKEYVPPVIKVSSVEPKKKGRKPKAN